MTAINKLEYGVSSQFVTMKLKLGDQVCIIRIVEVK